MSKRSAEWVPAEAFPVGEYIQEELVERGWTFADLAGRTGMFVAEVEELIGGDRKLLVRDAERLEVALGVRATTLLNLDRTYRKWKAAQAEGGG